MVCRRFGLRNLGRTISLATSSGNNYQILVAKRQDGDGSETIALLDNAFAHPPAGDLAGFMEQ
jgi:hypothetical protein